VYADHLEYSDLIGCNRGRPRDFGALAHLLHRVGLISGLVLGTPDGRKGASTEFSANLVIRFSAPRDSGRPSRRSGGLLELGALHRLS